MENFIFCAVKVLQLIDEKSVLKKIKPRFNQNSDKIELSEKGPILNDDKVIDTNINNYFADINLDTVNSSISRYQNIIERRFFHDHLSMKKIKKRFKNVIVKSFEFSKSSVEQAILKGLSCNVIKSLQIALYLQQLIKHLLDFLLTYQRTAYLSIPGYYFPDKDKNSKIFLLFREK